MIYHYKKWGISWRIKPSRDVRKCVRKGSFDSQIIVETKVGSNSSGEEFSTLWNEASGDQRTPDASYGELPTPLFLFFKTFPSARNQIGSSSSFARNQKTLRRLNCMCEKRVQANKPYNCTVSSVVLLINW